MPLPASPTSKQEDFDSLEIYIDFFRGLAGFHHFAFPQFAAVAENAEHDAGPGSVFDFVVHAHESGESFGAAF